MQSSNGDGSIRQRPDGRWEGRYSWRDDFGKRQRGSIYAATRNQARAKLRERLVAVEAGWRPAERTPQMTVGQLLDHWMAFRREARLVRPSTLQAHEVRVRCHLQPGLGSIPLARLSTDDIERCYGAMKVSPSTVAGAHKVLHAALRYARRHKWIATDPSEDIDPRLIRSEPPTSIRALTLEEVHAVLRVLRGAPDEALWVTAITTGMRFGELAGLKWVAVAPDLSWLRVELTVTRIKGVGLVEQPPKTAGSIRVIGLPQTTRTALDRHRAAQPAGVRFVFAMPDGGPIYQTWANRRWHAIQLEAGIPKQRQVRMHDTRRTSQELEAPTKEWKVSEGRHGWTNTRQMMHYMGPAAQQPVLDHIDRVLAG